MAETLTGESAYDAFAPDGGRWSPWVKPTPFAHFKTAPPLPADAFPESPLPALPPADGRSAVVIDLPSEAAVLAGLTAARAGFRPVPLFNANSAPGRERESVDTKDVRSALHAVALALRDLRLPIDAPPAFLLDANRLGTSLRARRPPPGDFDNRWITLPQDWPSANLLLSHGVEEVVVIQASRGIAADLAHVLRRWQDAGVRFRGAAWHAAESRPFTVPRPPRFRSIWYRLLATFGFKVGAAGAFGAVIPEPSSGGYG